MSKNKNQCTCNPYLKKCYTIFFCTNKSLLICFHIILSGVYQHWLNVFPSFLCVISDAPSTEQQELFTQKLQQCCMLFDFLDSVIDLKSKEIKRATLNELVDYVSTNRGVLVESAYPEITNMVRIHPCSAYSLNNLCEKPTSTRVFNLSSFFYLLMFSYFKSFVLIT